MRKLITKVFNSINIWWKGKNDSRSGLEKLTDVATIISALGILVAIYQVRSQNDQFMASFELSNKQFKYQLKQDSLQDKADSIKDYRDSVKLNLAISEFAENKKNQEEEAKRNEFQFQKNIQTYQELVRTNKQSNEYIVNSQRPYLNLEFKEMSVVNDSIINFVIHFNNLGLRRPFLRRITYIFINSELNSFHADTSLYEGTPIGNDKANFTMNDNKYINLLKKEERNKIDVNFILDVSYLDELTNTVYDQRFHHKMSDLKSPVINTIEPILTEKQALDKFIESKRKKISRTTNQTILPQTKPKNAKN